MGIVKRQFKYRDNSKLHDLHELIEKVFEMYNVNLFKSNILRERDQLLLKWYFNDCFTFYEIGTRLGISGNQVGRLLDRIHFKLNREYRPYELLDEESKIKNAISCRLIQARNNKRFSQRYVQETLSMTQKILNEMESGYFILEDRVLEPFCKLYGVTLDWLKGNTIFSAVTVNEQQKLLDELVFADKELLRLISKIGNEDVALLKDLIIRLKSYTGTDLRLFEGSREVMVEAKINLLEMDIAMADFSTRVFNALTRAGIQTVGDLIDKKQSDLTKLRNLGHGSINEILAFVEGHGLRFCDEVGLDVEEVQAMTQGCIREPGDDLTWLESFCDEVGLDVEEVQAMTQGCIREPGDGIGV